MGKIKLILPDFLSFGRNTILLDICKNHPNIIREDTEIYSFYGTFPNAIWNGGSYIFDLQNSSEKHMKKVRDFYNKRGIKLTFTFTNSLITEEHLDDEYCNKILDIFHNGKNEVLIVSPILERYIRENYPNYKINRSIINTEDGSFLTNNYHLSVLSKFKNKDFNFLSTLSREEKQKTEILCNEFCINDCPFAYKHYKEYAWIQLNREIPQDKGKSFGECRYEEEQQILLHKRFKNSKYYISPEDIKNIYSPFGFEYFKLGGRGPFNIRSTDMIIDYLIKPEFQADVRVFVYERMFTDFREKSNYNFKYNKIYAEHFDENNFYV